MINRIAAFAGALGAELGAVRRRRMVLLVLLALPVIYPTLLSYLYSNRQARQRPALIVDDDRSALSRELALDLEATQGLSIADPPGSLDEATELIRQQRAELLVYIPEDFSRRIKRGEQASLRTWASTANMYTYGVALLALNDAVLDFNTRLGQRYLRGRGLPRVGAADHVLPIAWEQRDLFLRSGSYGDFMMMGIFLIVIQQLVLITLAYSIGWQREDGERLAGPYLFSKLAGRAAAHLGFHLAGITFIVLVVCPMFAWPVQSAGAAWVLFAALAVAMVPPALLVAYLTPDRFVGFQLLLFFSTPIFMMSGFSWPQSRMAEGVQLVAWLFPATPALQAMRVLSAKSGDLAAVLPSLKAMGLQFVIWSALCWAVVRTSAQLALRRRSRALVEAPALELPRAS